MNWYEIKNISEIDTPALIVFPDRIQSNLTEAIRMVGDVARLRPHIKTHKSKEAAQMMLEAGVTKFKCATIAEAELLGMIKSPDVLLAYQPVGPNINRLIQLILRFPHTQYACLVDDMQTTSLIDTYADSKKINIEVFIDLDNGMHRTGISPDQKAVELYQFCKKSKRLRIRGFHAYDGHIRDLDIQERRLKSDLSYDSIMRLKNSLPSGSGDDLDMICGGSPTFPFHAQRQEVECSPGTFIYWDQGYADLYEGRSFLPAAVLVTRVISIPFHNQITCDLGHKSVASENDIKHRVHFLNVKDLEPISQSEEHLVLKTLPDHNFSVGDVLYGIPHHICPTVALYEKVYTAYQNTVTGEWRNIARDRRISI